MRTIENERYCYSLLLQSLSIQGSPKSLNHLILESRLKIHVVEHMQNNNEQPKAIKELLKVYTMSSKH